MIAKIKKSRASGSVKAPSSKSMAHRLIISAAMAEGVSYIGNVNFCDDVLATADCLSKLGAKIVKTNDGYKINGCNMRRTAAAEILNCRESGSTLRFMIPVAALSGSKTVLSGSKRLFERPLTVYEQIFSEKEIFLSKIGNIVFVDGPLPNGDYIIPGNISSQFISGLLFALPILEGNSSIKIKPPFESIPYVNMTLLALSKFGVEAYFEDEYTLKIPGGQKYTPFSSDVEGDYSAAAFLEALSYVGGNVTVLGLSDTSEQGDRAYLDFFPLLKDFAPTIDIENCPDLAPILFALAAYFNGATFTGTKRLKIKESDRASAMADELRKFGAELTLEENRVIVKKSNLHTPVEVLCGHNDHRIVMALSVLLSVFGGEICEAEAVRKSYPGFFSDIASLGIEVTLYD